MTEPGTEAPPRSDAPSPGDSSKKRGVELPTHVTVLRQPHPDGGERVVHIVGTAHVSQQSVDEVRRVIEEVRPDTVCVELDAMRYEALVDDSRWRKLNIFDVIRQRKVLFLMASLALQAFQRRLGDKLGVRPGAELLAAADKAKELGAELVLADRDVQATLRRTWAALSFFTKLKVVSMLMALVLYDDDIEASEVEALKNQGHVSFKIREAAEHLPGSRTPFIDERDQYLMSSVEAAPGRTLVVVVGAAHVAGMVAHQGKPVDREALSKIPPPSWVGQGLKWVIPTVILLAFYYGYRQHAGEGLRTMLYAWVLPNAIMAGVLTLAAGGKLLSVLTATIASPITSLNPTIGAGMVVGLVEAWLRKPTVEDCERLGKEVTTLRGMHKNPFSRILIVAIAATVGSALGAYIGATWVLTLL